MFFSFFAKKSDISPPSNAIKRSLSNCTGWKEKHDGIFRLTAKRMQLKRQSDEINKSVERARETQRELANSLKQEAHETEILIRQYEDSLEEIADRFRKTRGYYNEEKIYNETENVTTASKQLDDELEKRQSMVDELKSQLNMIQPGVPEDFLTMMGKNALDAKVKELTENLETLIKKRNYLLNQNTLKKM